MPDDRIDDEFSDWMIESDEGIIPAWGGKEKKIYRLTGINWDREGVPFAIPSVDEILDREVLIGGCEIRQGEYGRYVVVRCRTQGETMWHPYVCGGRIVVSKLEVLQRKGMFPCVGMFTKIGKRYDLR